MSKHEDQGSGYKAVEKLSNLFKNQIKCLKDYSMKERKDMKMNEKFFLSAE